MSRGTLDGLLDFAVVPGYSRLGYRLRGLRWEDAVAGDLRTALVTGGTSGIGEAICEGLVQAGARVHLLGRDPRRVSEAIRRIASRVPDAPGVLVPEVCDVSTLSDVHRFAGHFVGRHQELDVLVHNAGVLAQRRELTDDGVELTFATNVLGPFLLTTLLLPVLQSAAPARVITVSSGGMYTARLRPDDIQLEDELFDGSGVYAHTKRIQVVLNELWAEREPAREIAFSAMHPGWVDTPGLRSSLPRFARATRSLLRSAREGADTAVWLATAPSPEPASGGFWHDRAPRTTHRGPWTRESVDERRRLWSACEALTGMARRVPTSRPD
jgi:NAD(P)-dependent dehydrogenase (short-subunit alcohol dehydrogenase family)